ncbi:hypothetical protein K474DRAFT_715133 [Panus rudis PR-1116 ss-1]|nr:hypothetical protein K474DRAFT_715133 [Panus rudis PR-1116 ss-1]
MKSPAASARSLSPTANDERRVDDVPGSPREDEEESQEPSPPIMPSPPKLRRSSRARSQTPAPIPEPPTMAGRKRARQGSAKPQSVRNQEQVREQTVESSKPPSKRRKAPSQPSRSGSGVSEASIGSRRGAKRRGNKAALDPVADRIPEEEESPPDPLNPTETDNEGTARVVGLTVGSLVVTPSPSKHPSTQPEDKSGGGSDSQTVSELGTQTQLHLQTQSQSHSQSFSQSQTQTQRWATQAPSRFANGYNFSQVPLQTQAPYQSQDDDL